MTVGIVIVTHGTSGESLLEEAGFVLGRTLDDIPFVAFNHSSELNNEVPEIRSSIERADGGDGVLVLTDLIGASPANLVAATLEDYNAVMVTGINLGMLIRVCNYRQETLERLVRKAVEGGRNAVKILQK